MSSSFKSVVNWEEMRENICLGANAALKGFLFQMDGFLVTFHRTALTECLNRYNTNNEIVYDLSIHPFLKKQ